MSNELANILQNSAAIVQTGLDEDTLAVAGGATSGAKRISIRGKTFRKIVGGKEVSVVEDNYMNVVIVKMAHNASRTFYAEAYKEGETSGPACWSSDSRTPDAEVPNPQAKSCDTCPNSVRGSGAGGTGSACRLSWRLAVVLPHDPSGDVMQLVLPATSAFGKEENGKWPFRPYVQMLANNNVSAGRVVTRMQFDSKSSTPKLVFSPAAAVNQEDLDVLQKQSKSEAAERAIKLTVYQSDTQGQEATTPAPAVEVKETVVDEPVLREEVQAKTEKVNDVSDIVKKWSTKD
jgi:hypothetical protein